ncbi:Nucleotide-binding universal stress UspA family protein OS=Castellaniella defragrans OX=75697 GN=HNR28_003216 PE=4 SV=1 [Castellaniella defragrans]
MSFKSILVNFNIDEPIEPVFKAASDLARHFQARIVGFCTADAAIPFTSPEGEPMAAEVWRQLREDIETRFKQLHTDFDRLSSGSGLQAEWRESLDFPTRGLAEASRIADLIVMSTASDGHDGTTSRTADPGSVALQAGRPLLLLAHEGSHAPFRRVVIAWKDTREARRAVADAVPLLSSAQEVSIVTVTNAPDSSTREGIADVATFLSRHGISARAETIEAADENAKLWEFITSDRADLVVSGAYGHSRLREWAFGGVTRSLLGESGLNRFMSS